MSRRRICVVLTTRGNYAKMRSTMLALRASPAIELQVIVGGALLLPRYGGVAATIEADGFDIAERCQFVVEGETLAAIAASSALATAQFAQALTRLRSDIVVVVADRYEALALAQAAVCLNIRIAHIEGGEVSGSIDERIRHAVTKLSHVHFVANEEAYGRVIRMGEIPSTVHITGTPSLDVLADIDLTDVSSAARLLAVQGSGAEIDLADRFLVVSQHAVATQPDIALGQALETLSAVREVALPTIWILPNNDAGAGDLRDGLSRAVDEFPIRFIGALPFPAYAVLLRQAACLVGNTSSGIREAEYLGVPVVNIGNRQFGRQRGANVVDVDHNGPAIAVAIRNQIAHGRYASQHIYGDGLAGAKIAQILATTDVGIDKTITY